MLNNEEWDELLLITIKMFDPEFEPEEEPK
jgi:hypothetical protein